MTKLLLLLLIVTLIKYLWCCVMSAKVTVSVTEFIHTAAGLHKKLSDLGSKFPAIVDCYHLDSPLFCT